MIKKRPLSETHPDLAAEADGWDSQTVTAGSGLKKSWACRLGHKWEAVVGERVAGTGCPYCSGRRVLVGFNDLATTHPELAMEAHGWDPQKLSSGSNRKVEWICRLAHIWVTSVAHRSIGKTGCPYCRNLKLLLGFNDLSTRFPSVAQEADGWDPESVVFGTAKKCKWVCQFGHRWTTTVVSRTRDGRGCPNCAGQQVIVGVNDLKTTHPEVAKTAYGWDTSAVMAGNSTKRLQWLCDLGHVYIKSVSNRALRGDGCPICSGRQVLAGFNDLATTHPVLASEANGWDPATIRPGSNRKFEWMCLEGHIWVASINSRTGPNKSGCPFCSNQRVLSGYNDMLTTYPNLAREAFGWDPTTVIAGTPKKLEWKCESGHKWVVSGDSRMRGSGCPSCAKYGFSPDKRAWLYLVRHADFKLQQIGITNDPERRLSEHQRRDWELVDLRGPMDGVLAYEWEQSMFRFLRAIPVVLGPPNPHGKFDGYTESWDESEFSVDSLKKLMDLIDERESDPKGSS